MQLPQDKVVTLRQSIQTVVTSKKVTLKTLQSLIGLLNFACKTVGPGRAFSRRLIDATIGIKKLYHMIRVNKAMKADLAVWQQFLEYFNGVTVITSGFWSSDNSLQLFFRVGEFTVINPNIPHSSHCIQFQHIEAHPKKLYLKLTIPHSKTYQVGKITTLIIHSQRQSTLCPVKATLDFVQIRPHTPANHYSLTHLDTKPLTRYQFNAVLQRAITTLPILGHFVTHSFRIGRATDLALQGTTESDIQKFGRWKSTAFLKYIGSRNSFPYKFHIPLH